MAKASLEFSVAVDSGQVKSNLDQIKAAFASATAGINASLSSIKGFADLKRQTQDAAKEYAAAQAKVAALAKEINAGAGGKALAKDFERAKAAAATLKQVMEGQQAELQRMRQSMARAGISTTALGAAQGKLRAELEQTRAKYQSMAAVANARDALGVRPHAEMRAEIARVGMAYKTLAQSGQLSAREQAQAWVKMKDQVADLKGEMNGWAQSIGEVRGQLLAAGAAAFAWGRGVVGAMQAAIGFEAAMADVKKVVDATPAQMEQLKGEILQLGRVIPTAQDGLAKIAAMGGQMGLPAEEIKGFTRVAATMGTAFSMSADEVGQAIGTLKSIFGLSIPEVAALGDNINTLGNTMATNEKNIIEVMNRIGGSVKVFGLSKEGAAALSATMLELGQSPEVASTSINTLLTKLQTANVQTDKFKGALESIGLSAEQMAAMVNYKPQQAIDTLLATLSKLSKQEQAEALTNLFGAEYQDNIALLIQGLASYKKALAEVSDQSRVLGSTEREAAERNKTSAAQLQLLRNGWNEVAINVGDVFLPALNQVVAVLRDVTGAMADFAKNFPNLTGAMVGAAGAAATFFALFAARKALMLAFGGSVLGLAANMRTLGASIVSASAVSVPALARMRGGFLGMLGAGAAFVGYKLGEELGNELWGVNQTLRETAEIQRQVDVGARKVADAFEEVSRSTGETITSMEQLDQLVKEGKVHFDQLTGTWKKGAMEQQQVTQQTAVAMKQVTGEALQAMQKQYQSYVKEVQRLQGEIAGRQRSLAAELRDMARGSMSGLSAWKDQKREAEEYVQAAKRAAKEAQAAMASGDTIAAAEKWKEAVSYADDAKTAYKSLNTEVKDGERVVVSQQQALKTAMQGVEQAGSLAIDLLKQQDQAAKAAMQSLENEVGFDKLTEGMDAAEQTWLENWKNMQSYAADQIITIERKLEGLVKDRHVTVWVQEKVKKATGGPVGFARGGRLPGYGGGDRISALLEAGEYVIRKEAVSRYGSGLFHALNNLRLPEIPPLAFATGGPAGPSPEFGTVNFNLGGQVVVGRTDRETYRTLQRVAGNMQRRASR